MRWLLLFLVCVPLVSAADWYYPGDSFKIGDTLYAVEGSSYERVLFSAAGRSYIIGLGECVKDGLSQYCYNRSAYPSDEKHIKYAAGEKYYGYYLDIQAIQPKLTITRVALPKVPKLGEEIVVTVTIKNTGEYVAEFFTYTENAPSGMTLINAPGMEYGNITFTRKSIIPGEELYFKYTMRPTDYVNAQMLPNITYTYEGASFSGKTTPLTLFVDTPVAVNRSMPASANLGEHITYRLNITNKGDEEMLVQTGIRLPAGLRLIRNDLNGTEIKVKAGATQHFVLVFYGAAGGSYRVPVELNATIHGTTFKRYYDEAISIKADKLVPTLQITPKRASYAAGERIGVIATLNNPNDGVTLKSVSGRISGAGADRGINASELGPKKQVSEAIDLVLPQVENTTTYTLTLKGTYATSLGSILDFETTQSIVVEPLVESVAITRKIEPATPVPGGNVTVTVTGKNTAGKYITFAAADTSELRRSSGLAYVQTSLDRDQTQVLYTYQLEVPSDFNGSSFNITTTVRLKDEEPTVTSVTVKVKDAPQQAGSSQEQEGLTRPAEDKKKLGFFASVWDFMKNLF